MSNLTVTEVVANYRNERINRLYRFQQEEDSLPGMRELKDKKKKILQKTLLNSLEDIVDKSLNDELKKIALEETKLLSSIQNEYACNLCKDTGINNGKYCKCLRDVIYRDVYGATQIDNLIESFEASNHSFFDTGFQCVDGSQLIRYKRLEKYAKTYAVSFPNNKKPNLFLTGNTGLGKTFILRSIAKHIHQYGSDVLLIDASELFGVFHRHRLGYDVDLEPMFNCDLLLIDDLGVEPTTQNVTVEYFLDLLNKRIDKKKHTIVATNLSIDKINARYGERVYSRIRFKELCDQLVFEGLDIRIK